MKWFIVTINLIILITSQINEDRLTNFPCAKDLDCGSLNRGQCVQGYCQCNEGYTTFPLESRDVCNYEKSTQKRAFLYELFFIVGGNFYAARNTHAALKLVAFIFGIYIICLMPISLKFISQKLESECVVISVACFYYFCALGLAFWFVYDLVQFGMNNYVDGNGVQLEPW
jgi:hypothetical protein